MKSEDKAPLAPVAKIGAPASPPSASLNEVCWRRARSAAVIWSTTVPRVFVAAGVRVPVVMNGSSWAGVICARIFAGTMNESAARAANAGSAGNTNLLRRGFRVGCLE